MTRVKVDSVWTRVGLALGGACTLAGTWRAVDIDPPDAIGVIRTMTVDGQRFTATTEDGTKLRTTTGAFEWNGSRLTLRTSGGPARVFSGRKSGGKLTLVDKRPDGPVRTTFEKVAD